MARNRVLKSGSEFGARVWSLGAQSLESGSEFGVKSGVSVKVWGQSLESVWVGVWIRVCGQSPDSGSEFGSGFGVWIRVLGPRF